MKSVLVAAFAAAMIATPALAQSTNTNTTVTTLDGTQGFANYEPNATSSSTITPNMALSADGSLQISGTLNRVQSGTNFSPNPANSLGLANDLVSLTGDYLVTSGSVDGIQSPAFRVYIQDGAVRSELVYEASNNGGVTVGTPQQVFADSLFYEFVGNGTARGPILNSTGGYVLRTLADYGDTYSATAFISAFGVGNGNCPSTSSVSGATNCANFSALADNLVLTTTGATRSVNFAASVTGAVPEPATWAMMLFGFGAMGVSVRRQRRTNNLLQAA
jgi:PEP-CTERM motif